MKNIVYRTMQPSDIDGVFEIEKLSFSNPWSKNSITSELKNPISRYFVAESDGRILGYAGIWYILDEGHITNVAVHPDYRGKKIGDGLISFMVNSCKKDMITSMTLEVRKSNTVAQSLYKKHGFLQEGVRKEYYDDNKEDAILMWKHMKGE